MGDELWCVTPIGYFSCQPSHYIYVLFVTHVDLLPMSDSLRTKQKCPPPVDFAKLQLQLQLHAKTMAASRPNAVPVAHAMAKFFATVLVIAQEAHKEANAAWAQMSTDEKRRYIEPGEFATSKLNFALQSVHAAALTLAILLDGATPPAA